MISGQIAGSLKRSSVEHVPLIAKHPRVCRSSGKRKAGSDSNAGEREQGRAHEEAGKVGVLQRPNLTACATREKAALGRLRRDRLSNPNVSGRIPEVDE